MLVALAVSLATRGGVGMGDVKLAFLLGAGLGWDVVGAVVVAMLATFVVAVGILLRRGIKARKETFPFGPFLVFGALVALFFS
jgi:prepilin signal peptidase PulO-like enzyme (type II secretory pathway)